MPRRTDRQKPRAIPLYARDDGTGWILAYAVEDGSVSQTDYRAGQPLLFPPRPTSADPAVTESEFFEVTSVTRGRLEARSIKTFTGPNLGCRIDRKLVYSLIEPCEAPCEIVGPSVYMDPYRCRCPE